MVKIKGELYNFEINHTNIIVSPLISSLHRVTIASNAEEDFSIFDLGPAIAGNIIMEAGQCNIDTQSYERICLTVNQVPRKSIEFIIRQPRANINDPVDSGEVIYTFRDYINKYE